MDFGLSDEHQLIRDSVREFCEQEIGPIAQEIKDEHRSPERFSTSWGSST